MATGHAQPHPSPNEALPASPRPLRLVSIGEETTAADASPSLSPTSPSPALRRLQRELAAAHAEARSMRELLEELPAILERKFQQRLQALLQEQRQLERDNALLQQQLLTLLGAGEPVLASPLLPAAPPSCEGDPRARTSGDPQEEAPITSGLGLRRALRLLQR